MTHMTQLEKNLLEADLESAWLGLVQAVDRMGSAAARTGGETQKTFLRVKENLEQNESYLEREFGLKKKRIKRGVMVSVTPIL